MRHGVIKGFLEGESNYIRGHMNEYVIIWGRYSYNAHAGNLATILNPFF